MTLGVIASCLGGCTGALSTTPPDAGSSVDAGSDGRLDDATGPDAIAADSGPTPALDRYEPVEISLTALNDHANPYVDVELTAFVEPPAGSGEAPYAIAGFWDGGNVWRLRWAPRSAGTYTVRTECSDPTDAGLHGQGFAFGVGSTYSLEWAPHGFLGIDTIARHYFERDDGTPFLWVGDTHWVNLYEVAWDQPIATDDYWRTVCDARAEQGFNVLQAVVYNDSEHWDDGEQPFVGSDPDRINPVSWQRVDARVTYAVRRQLLVYLMTSSNGMHFAWSEAQRARLYRYMVARYAAYDVAFGGGEEVDRGGVGGDAAYRHMIDSLHNLDPYRRLVAMHATDTGVKVVPDDVDFLLIQYYTSDIDYLEGERCSRTYGKPFVNGETYYFQNGQPGMDDPATIRRMAWRILLGGAAGYTYGHMGIVVPTGSPHPSSRDVSDARDASAEEMRKVAAWLGQPGLSWWRFDRFEDLGSGRHLSGESARQYVIHVEDDATSFAVDLSDAAGTLSGEWYDIENDAAAGMVAVPASAAVTISPPGPWHVLRLDAE